jgi:transcriptional regulator GlxA family with amidase domain
MPPASRRVVFLAPPSLQILDVTGPAEIFARTASVRDRLGLPTVEPYAVELISTQNETSVSTSSGLTLSPALPYTALRGPIDTLLVAGGGGVEQAGRDPELGAWLREQATAVRRIGSICTGAFVLAGAGLLDERTATTHWQWAELFRQNFPAVRLETERIFIREQNVSTSAGITAGMDLALSMVEEDHGHRVAMQIARELVMFLRRPGGQSQFSTALAGQFSDHELLKELVPWMLAHLHEKLRIEELAARAGLSERHFTRVFRERTGHSPATFLERLRVESACRRLEESSRGTKEIAAETGFSDADSMRRSFRRVLNTTPEAYRQHFSTVAD